MVPYLFLSATSLIGYTHPRTHRDYGGDELGTSRCQSKVSGVYSTAHFNSGLVDVHLNDDLLVRFSATLDMS